MKAARAFAILLLLMPFGAAAQQQQGSADALFTARILDTGPMGYDEDSKITCRGYPNCNGTFTSKVRFANCSNHITSQGTVVITGLNLAQSGTISGRITISPGAKDPVHLQGGSCIPGTQGPASDDFTYTGTWNLATRAGVMSVTVPGTNIFFSLPFRVDVNAAAPIFPMTVRAEIGPQVSTVSADIRFRPQDVGRIGSVFAFASAPATQVHVALESKAVHLGMSKAGEPCVLAQMQGGQLVAVTAAQLQAFVTGAFTAAGASVSILNNTPTPGVAGATYYVGYGATGSSMLGEGVFRNAAVIPGSGTCPPLPYQTALWWNPAESGWGLNLDQQGTIIFGTLFTYDAARLPMWLVMSAGTMQSDGLTFTGDLYRTTGPAFNANPFTPIGPANVTRVGDMTYTITEANAATLRYTVNGVVVEKSIQRQVFGSRAQVCLPTIDSRAGLTTYQDLWWIPSESGWGINLTHQDNTIFATLFTYDATGRGLWLVMSNGARQGDGSYFGDLFRVNGSPFNAVPFTPIGAADITNVGNMRLRFTDGNNGTLTYTYLGAPVTKAIVRQVFSTPVSTCN